jgi:hypothetical protein
MAKKNLTKVQLGKLVVANKEGDCVITPTVHQMLAAVGEPMTYPDILGLFDKAGVVVPGDDGSTKTHRVRRIRWAAYRLRKREHAKIVQKKGEPTTVVLTAAGKKNLEAS